MILKIISEINKALQKKLDTKGNFQRLMFVVEHMSKQKNTLV